MYRLIALLCLAGCASQPPSATALRCPTIPDTRPDVHPAPLPPVSADLITLEPGHWDWTGERYAWTSPSWVKRPGTTAYAAAHPMWQDGYWTQNGGACVWNPGHFLL